MMRILNVVAGADTGGDGIRTKWAFGRHSDWRYDTIIRMDNYIKYPREGDWKNAKALARLANVFHWRNNYATQKILRVYDRPSVVHYHGTGFRENPDSFLQEQQEHRSIGLVATLDLWLLAPEETEWLPAPYNLDWLFPLRQSVDDGIFRIAHAPTNREIKGTEAFLRAVDKLSKKINLELILIENKPWVECLALKSYADVYYDQVDLGYGNNAIEAWGMGIPVIAGADVLTTLEYERRFGSIPYVAADEDTIYDALHELADPETRKQWSDRGLEHVRSFHDEKLVVNQLKGIYRRAWERWN